MLLSGCLPCQSQLVNSHQAFKNSFKFETTVSKIEANDGNERGGEVGVSPNEAPDVSGAAWGAEAKRPPGIEREGSSRAGGTSSSLKGR
jgi:hypothetical protein